MKTIKKDYLLKGNQLNLCIKMTLNNQQRAQQNIVSKILKTQDETSWLMVNFQLFNKIALNDIEKNIEIQQTMCFSKKK